MTKKSPPTAAALQALYKSALDALGAGRFEESIALLEKVLAAAPSNGEIHNNLGTAHWKCRRLSKAEEHYAKAVKLSPDNALAHNNYGALLLELLRFDDAEKHFRRAYELKPDHPSVIHHRGLMLHRRGDFAGAEKSLRDSLALRPANAQGWALLLQLLEMTNRLDDAAQALARAKALFPDSVPIATVQARLLRRSGKAAEAIPELERLAPAITGTPPEGVAFFSELGQLYDLDNRPDAAFAAFQRANDIQAAQPGTNAIDKKAYTAITGRLTQELTPALVKAFPAPVPDERRAPVFLVGFPRSGTTLLNQILGSHPGVYAAEERAGVAAMGEYFTRAFGTTLKPGQVLQSGAEIWGDPAYPAAIPQLKTDDILAMRRAFYREHNADAQIGGKLFVDKMPVNMMHAAFISAVFPEAKFILALRHPCDCVLSCFMQAFEMNAAMARFLDITDAAHFYDEIFSVWEHTTTVLPLKAHHIRYEDVVAGFRPAVENLLAFLGLPWDDGVLAYDKTAQAKERINTASYHQVTQKIYTRASGRWRRYRKYLEPVTGILAPHARRYGYSMDTDE